jgi:hypothetical protein
MTSASTRGLRRADARCRDAAAASKRIVVRLQAGDAERLDVAARAKVTIAGRSAGRFGPVRNTAAAGELAGFALRPFRASQQGRIVRALRKGRRVRALARVGLTDPVGNSRSLTRRISMRR